MASLCISHVRVKHSFLLAGEVHSVCQASGAELFK